MAILGKLWAFSGNLTLTHVGLRLLWNLEHKVTVFPKEMPSLPQPQTRHLTNRDLLCLLQSGNLHPVQPKRTEMQPAIEQSPGEVGLPALCVLTLGLLVSHQPQSRWASPRMQTLCLPLRQRVLV